jgi:hypothetical protein
VPAVILVVLLGGCLRMIGLEKCPNGFFRDEVEKGYNAWALASTGGVLHMDPQDGLHWERTPWMVSVMGTHTSAIYQYLTVPMVAAGGLSIRSTRMTAAFVGTLTILLLACLVSRMLGVIAGVFAGAWLGFVPWHLVFSRWALQGIFVPFFMVITLFGIYGIERDRKWGLPVALGSLGLLFYSYSGAQPFVIAWAVCLFIIYRRKISWHRPWTWVAFILFLAPVIPTLMVRLEPGGSERIQRISIWGDADSIPIILGRFIRNYFSHLDPRFLFLSGDSHPRHSPPNMGQLLPADLFLLPVGLVYSIRKRMIMAAPLIAALLCAAVPAALTREGIPHALRSVGMLIPCVVFSAAGFGLIVVWIRKSLPTPRSGVIISLVILVCLIAGVSSVVRTLYFYAQSPLARQAFQDGQCDAWQKIAAERKPGEPVYVRASVPYAAYYQLFFADRRSPVSVAEEGMFADGVCIYDPEQENPVARMEPGTLYWHMARYPPQVLWPGDGTAMHDAISLTGEAWVGIERQVVE